jgi:predicted nucleotidyltransferase
MFWKAKKEEEEEFQHNIEKGDHLIRWTHMVLWPVQVHAVCISACDGSITVVDFGLTAKKNVSEVEDDNVSLEEMVNQEDRALIDAAARRKDRMVGPARISILTLTEEKDIRQWKKVEYGEAINKKKNKWWFWKEKTEETECDQQENDAGKEQSETADQQEPPAAVPKLPKSDPTNIVLARLRYLLENPQVLPPHHILFSNSECIAVWVKTGTWSTLQASIFLHATTVGNLKNTATLTASLAAATTTVTAPAAGVWGWLGFSTTTQVGLLAAQPWLIPVLAGYGIIAIGTPIIILKKCKERWRDATQKLTEGFWEWADSDVYVEAIKSWSGLQ